MSLKSKIETLLFVAGRPLTVKKIAEFIDGEEEDISESLKELIQDYTARGQGIRIFSTGNSFQMGTAGENAAVLEKFVKAEFAGELTRPQLETLTVIAYRGPIAKGELEIIRGVNCGLILRNLLIRGLVDEEFDSKKKETRFRVSMDFLRYLGASSVENLPEYDKLHSHEILQTILQQQEQKA
ncbi:SMC-Scp complex subunit ScpB [Candidatus Uhrbacteria bacterium]|nr:SMC-Scp complex subunit ScpB [Candidatus Uhrbacteria bacterium]